jgi:hypothetical protein
MTQANNMTQPAKRISYSSLQGVAISQEIIIRNLTQVNEWQRNRSRPETLREAKKVLSSLNRMCEEHPHHDTSKAVNSEPDKTVDAVWLRNMAQG